MKYIVALVIGMATGVAMVVALLYANPFAAAPAVSPLAVTDEPTLTLLYDAEPGATIFHSSTSNGSSRLQPAGAAELWENTLADSWIDVVELSNSRGQFAGIGIKFTTQSERTRLINAEALVDSAWHIYLPGRGSLLASQTENYWSYLRDIVVKARLDGAGNWRGAWNGIMTVGPNSIGTGRVTGTGGEFSGRAGEIVESLNAQAYSSQQGPVAMQGSLTIALPEAAAALDPDSSR